ncbi:MAG TPA: chemotaxis protein CheB [Silvibacterium sp.]|nr:chemotaxis protein CheB [Silvibacterium sp.]
MKSAGSQPAFSTKEHPKRKDAPRRKVSFPVVAIGASAGGLEAYKEFFHALPTDSGMAFVLIQHLDPNHESMLTEIISKTTRMPVEEVRSGVAIQPNHVYVIPPNALMALAGGVFQLSPRGKAPGQHLAVNFFMHSLAQERKSGAIAIVLSGTGADGTVGMEDVKAEGGITFAQDPATAKYDGMPRSVIDAGCVDFILAPKEMGKELRRIQHHPYVHLETPEDEDSSAEKPGAESGAEPQDLGLASPEPPASHTKDFSSVLAQLRKSSGVDFSLYKPNTIQRRALRRMLLLKVDSLREYATYLKEHPEEGGKLFDDVLIPVTSFFRDFEAFEALKTQVYPAIVKDKGNKGTIRMWAPGCSTGEETYSLAMTLLEFLGERASSFQVQIFGTDLNEKGIQKARAGVYRESIAEEISPERMGRFFVKVPEGYRVNKAVRDMCVFARQNLANDPPFSQMNVVACRNLLIYIQPVLQKKIIPILHYALKSSGFLVLGSSESVSAFPELFSTVDKKHKIYGKKAITSRLHYDFAQSYYPQQGTLRASGNALKSQFADQGELDVQAEADRVVLREHAPVGVVINRQMEVVQFRGHTAPYLAPPPGRPSVNVLKLARNGLAIELRALITAVTKKGGAATKDGVAFDENGHKRMLNLSVTPLGDKRSTEKGAQDNRLLLILFDDVTPQWTPAAEATLQRQSKGSNKSGQEGRRLKQELASTRDALRSAIESEDSLKEEFQSANEEILSANEELQSTNEELETSKEELQSANEELNTLNAELRNKNSELHELSNDILNLLNSTRIPVVMLDRRLYIRRITPAATKLFKVVPADIGRPFADIKLNIAESDTTSHDLELEIAKVLDSLQPIVREVQDLQGCWHELSVLPYRTQDNKIDGVVLALQDVDAVKRSQRYLQTIIENIPTPLLALDADLRVRFANETFCATFQVPHEETVGQLLNVLGNEQWKVPALIQLLEKVLPEHKLVKNFSVTHEFPRIGRKTMLVSARRIEDIIGHRAPLILLTIEDVTENAKIVDTLRASEERFRTLFNLGPVAVYYCDISGTIQNFNRRAVELWGRTPAAGDTDEQFCGSYKLFQPNGSFMPHDECPMAEVLNGKIQEARDQEVLIERPDGSRVVVVVNIRPLKNDHGEITGAINCFYDISERKLTEAALMKSEKLAVAGRLAATLAHEINNPLQAVANLVSIWAQSPGLDAQGQAYAGMAEGELRRVSHLAQQALSFYRESASPIPVNLEEAIDSVLSIYEKRIEAKRIDVTRRYKSGGTAIRTFPGEIRQVFSTLLLNAIEAIGAGGTINIRVRNASHWQKSGVRGIRVTITDNGVGIPASNLARIFEPFFTTKGENGTGLGLWVASGIVDRFGGSILTRSSVHPAKHGSCFSIFLPSKA